MTKKPASERSPITVSIKPLVYKVFMWIVLFIAKFAYLTILAITGAFLWFMLSGLLSQVMPSGYMYIAPLLTGGVFLVLFIGLYIAWRRSDKALKRWTAKSSVAIMPFMVIGSLGLFALMFYAPNANEVSSAGGIIGDQNSATEATFTENGLLSATNDARADNDKGELQLSKKLNQSALSKCRDMVANDYWGHNDAQGREPWRFFDDAGYRYSSAGENLAYGFATNKAVVTGWMNSPSHKANVLGDYSEVGFGVCNSDDFVNQGAKYIVVQHFGIPAAGTSYDSASQQPTNRSLQPSYTQYVASTCSKTPIPRSTDYIEVDYLYEGETQTYDGWDGYRETCTADSNGYKPRDYVSQPYNDTIYVGTKMRQGSQSSNPDYSVCSQFSDTGAYRACIDAINRQHRP